MPHLTPPAVTYRARWVWSAGRWIEGGRVTVAGRRIVAVGAERQPSEIDLGEQVLLPGLVNAHTHLEFSSLTQPLPFDQTFASWIRRVVEWRQGQTDADNCEAIELGLAESARAGASALGEISTRYWDTSPPMSEAPVDLAPFTPQAPHVVVFDEVLGLQPEAKAPQMADACRHLIVGATRSPGDSERVNEWSPGLSPHAPYSVSRELFEGVLSLATGADCPVAMHLAETREELEFLASGTGPLADLFATWGLWTPGQRAAFRSPLEVLQQLSALSRVLVIHGNYLTPAELDFLAGKDQFSVVYCPRTHAYFQHDRYPLAALLQRGIRVALGTDSRASNPDLNLLSEVRHVGQQHPDIAPATLIEMATRHGAEALGLGHFLGTIAPGRRADFCLLPIGSHIRDPFEVVLDSPHQQSEHH